MRCGDEHQLKHVCLGAAPAGWTLRSRFFPPEVYGRAAAPSRGPEPGLRLCSRHLELTVSSLNLRCGRRTGWDHLSEKPGQSIEPSNAGEGVSDRRAHRWSRGWETLWPLWKTVWQFLIKLKMLMPCDATATLLGIYPKDCKSYVHTNT